MRTMPACSEMHLQLKRGKETPRCKLPLNYPVNVGFSVNTELFSIEETEILGDGNGTTVQPIKIRFV